MYSPMFFASISPRKVTSVAAGDCAVTFAMPTTITASAPACTSLFILAPFALPSTIPDRIVNETWQRRALYVAGAWNIIGGASALANPDAHFAQFYTSALSLDNPLQAFFYRTTWINAIAWGVGYAMAGRFADARVPVLAAGGGGKEADCGACIGLLVSGVCRRWAVRTDMAGAPLRAAVAAILLRDRATR